MTFVQAFAGVEQPDVASLTRNGVFFRAYVWRNASRNTIGGAVYVEQEQGQRVEVSTATIRDVETATSGTDDGDSPRVIPVADRYFIAHWLENRSGLQGTVRRAIFDVDNVSAGWVDQGSVAVHDYALYDVDIIRGNSGEFVVARVTSATEITVSQYEAPYTWVDIVHTTTVTVNPAPRVCGVAATGDNGSITMVAYQGINDDANTLRVLVMDTSTGANTATGEVFADLTDAGDYSNVGLVPIPGSSRFVLLAEYIRTADTSSAPDWYGRTCAFKVMNGDATTFTSGQYIRNVHMASRPWIRAAGITGDYNVYALVGFKSMGDGQEWDQTNGYVIDLDYESWGTSVTVGTVRPWPVSAITNGSFDGRPSSNSPISSGQMPSPIGKRTNHVSHVSLAPQFASGPDVKSVTIAALHWERIISVQDADAGETQPAQASVRGVQFHHEDPWAARLDTAEPSAPASSNFKGLAPYSAGQSVEVGAGLVYSGGVLSMFDGRQLVEIGFPWVPEIVSAGTQGGTALDVGEYWYTVTAAWTDRLGQVHRSAPSRPMLISSASSGALDGRLVVRPINLTMKDNTLRYPEAGSVYLEVWRTTLVAGAPGVGAGSLLLFRRAHSGQTVSIEDTPTSDTDAITQVIVDSNPDSAVADADLLAWQLDTVTLQWSPATPTPLQSARVMTTWNNRLWTVPMDDPRVIRYSDEILPIGSQAAAPEFFDTNVFRFDSRGEITAMQPMDDKLIIFTRDAVYALVGTGNDGTGANATLQLQVVAEGTGCIEPRSVVLAPPGVMFQSAKGYYMLNRNTELDYVSAGAAVEDLIRRMGNIRAATLLEDRHQIRLVGNDAPVSSVEQPLVLIYDYLHRMWSEAPFQNLAGSATRLNALQAGCAWRGREGETCHVVLAQRGLAVERSSTDTVYADQRYDDTNVAIPIDVTVEWLKFAGIAGYQRVRRIVWICDMQDDCQMAYDLYVDRDGSYDETSPLDSNGWASPAPSHMVIRPSQQTGAAILVRLYETGTVPLTENLRINGLLLNVGIMKGPLRVSDANTGT